MAGKKSENITFSINKEICKKVLDEVKKIKEYKHLKKGTLFRALAIDRLIDLGILEEAKKGITGVIEVREIKTEPEKTDKDIFLG